MNLPSAICFLVVCCLVGILDCGLFHTGWLAVAAAVLAVFGVYLLLLRCRKGNPKWDVLTKYRYAHRGLHDKEHGVPENSLPAFRRAVEHGYGAELDIHLTKDGRLAVIHDNSLKRTAGADVNASELTAEELSRYRLEGTDEKIPFLEEVLPLFEGKTPLIVELKVDGGNSVPLAEAACAMLDKFHVNYCIESFYPQPIRWLAKNRPEICRGILSMDYLKQDTGMNFFLNWLLTDLFFNFLMVPDFVAYNCADRRRFAVRLARRVWKVREVSWTIRSPEELARCEGDGRLSIFEKFTPDP